MKITDEPPMFMVKGLDDEVAVKNSDYKYLIECAEIVEHLKKRIGELKKQKPIQEPNFSFHHIALYELQKILEGEK